jgi:hypothetical protein
MAIGVEFRAADARPDVQEVGILQAEQEAIEALPHHASNGLTARR